MDQSFDSLELAYRGPGGNRAICLWVDLPNSRQFLDKPEPLARLQFSAMVR